MFPTRELSAFMAPWITFTAGRQDYMNYGSR